MQLLCYIKYITNVISLPNWEGQADSGYHQIFSMKTMYVCGGYQKV